MSHDQATNLRRKISNVNKHIDMPKNAKTISIVSGKGGVGKSNVAINFSLELLARNKKVIIFDLDVGMGNIDILLGLQADQTIVDMIEKQLPIVDIIEEGPNQLAYLAGGTGLPDFFTMDEIKLAYFFEQYEKLAKIYDYIIFDLGAGATKESLLLISASDECMVITTPEPTSITDAYGMIKHIVNNNDEMPIYVIMNRCSNYRSGTRALQRFDRVIIHFLNIHIEKLGVLLEDKLVRTAVIRQVPFTLLNKKSPASKSLMQITTNYLNDSNNQKLKSFSFIDKLKQFIRKR